MDKFVAVYVRRSVSDVDKGNNSISIQGQKEDCISYIQKHYPNMEYKIYCDDGKSGKDVQHRPAFLQMMEDAKLGQIEVIIVKKYDRFSRNARDYMNVTNELQKYDVGVISLSEPFDTATKEGRMMRGIVLQFAEFERETIAYRAKDAYNIKAERTGFYLGGTVCFGYKPERQSINGKTGSILVPTNAADTVKSAYELYCKPDVSLKDLLTYIQEHNLNTNVITKNNKIYTRQMTRAHLSAMLKSPLYVRADINVYKYLKAQGYKMCDDVSAYDGVHGLFCHNAYSKDKFIKVGYHEGLVDAQTWLTVQEKKDGFPVHKNRSKPFNSWLSGVIKCSHCGYAIGVVKCMPDKPWRYLYDTGWYRKDKCVKRTLQIRPQQLEEIVLNAMQEKFKELVVKKSEKQKPNAELVALQLELQEVCNQLDELIEQIPKATETVMKYINQKVGSLDIQKGELESKIEKITRKQQSVDVDVISEPLQYWNELTNKEKYTIVRAVIDVIYVSDETGVEIVFSI